MLNHTCFFKILLEWGTYTYAKINFNSVHPE
jgi:hypothetical protein